MSQQEILIIEIMIFFFTAVFLWIRYSKLRYNSSDIDSIRISFLKAGVCTTVSIGLVLYLGTNDKRMTSLFCLFFVCSILIDIICFNYVKINEKYERMWDEDYYCEERIKDIDNLLKYSDYRLEYPDGDRLRFSKDGGWPSFNLKINTPIPDKDFYVELYTESSGCPHWIVYTSFYEKYNLLLR